MTTKSLLGSTSKRIKGECWTYPIIYGNTSGPLNQKKKNVKNPDHTHHWTLFVRGLNNEDLSPIIKKVTFKLHDSFHNPNQHIEKAPFEINETGWGEFEVQVKIHFTPMVLEKPVILYHMIRLHPLQDTKNVWKVGDMVYSVRYDEFVFNEPNEALNNYFRANPPPKLPPSAVDNLPFSIEDEKKEKKYLRELTLQTKLDNQKLKLEISQLNREIQAFKKEL